MEAEDPVCRRHSRWLELQVLSTYSAVCNCYGEVISAFEIRCVSTLQAGEIIEYRFWCYMLTLISETSCTFRREIDICRLLSTDEYLTDLCRRRDFLTIICGEVNRLMQGLLLVLSEIVLPIEFLDLHVVFLKMGGLYAELQRMHMQLTVPVELRGRRLGRATGVDAATEFLGIVGSGVDFRDETLEGPIINDDVPAPFERPREEAPDGFIRERAFGIFPRGSPEPDGARGVEPYILP
jgi:hypothetical protein